MAILPARTSGLFLACLLAVSTGRAGTAPAPSNLGAPPIAFEANRGQTDPQVRFLTRGPGRTLFLTPQEAVLTVAAPGPRRGARATVRMTFPGARKRPDLVPERPLPGVVNYFRGRDPNGWVRGVPTSAGVRYRELYPHTDLLFHGRDGRLEYDFVLQAGADPRRLRLAFQGASGLRLEPDGGLTVLAGGAELRQFRPEVYQEAPGGRIPVPGRFRLLAGNQVGFQVGRFDPARPLVIDPSVAWGVTGGSAQGNEWFTSVAVDPGTGDVIAVGSTDSAATYPTAGSGQPWPSTGFLPAQAIVDFLSGLASNPANGSDDLVSADLVNAQNNLSSITSFNLNGQPTDIDFNGQNNTLGDFLDDVCKLVNFGPPVPFQPGSTYSSGTTVMENNLIWIAVQPQATDDPMTELQAGRINASGTSSNQWWPVTCDPSSAQTGTFQSGAQLSPGLVIYAGNGSNYYLLTQALTLNASLDTTSFNPTREWIQLEAPERIGPISNAALVSALQSAKLAIHGGALAFMGIPDETVSMTAALGQVNTAMDAGLLVPYGIYNDTTSLNEFLSRLTTTLLGHLLAEVGLPLPPATGGAVITRFANGAPLPYPQPITYGPGDAATYGGLVWVVNPLLPSLPQNLGPGPNLSTNQAPLANGAPAMAWLPAGPDPAGATPVPAYSASTAYSQGAVVLDPEDWNDYLLVAASFLGNAIASGNPAPSANTSPTGPWVLATQASIRPVMEYSSVFDTSTDGRAVAVAPGSGDIYFGGAAWGQLPDSAASGAPAPFQLPAGQQPQAPASGVQGTYGGGFQDGYVGCVSGDGRTFRYFTYLGGSGNDVVQSLAVDPNFVYAGGSTSSPDLAKNLGSSAPYPGGGMDGFVAKLGLDLAPQQFTYLGGAGNDQVNALALDPGSDPDQKGYVFAAGWTTSDSFPATQRLTGASDPSNQPGYAFVAKLDPNLKVAYATVLGGPSRSGTSSDFISSLGVLPGSSGANAAWSGTAVSSATGLAVDGAGCAYVTGLTRAPGFPAKPLPNNPLAPFVAPLSAGLPQVFAVKLSPDGSTPLYQDLLAPGTSQPCLALDALGSAYVAGSFYVGANFNGVGNFQAAINQYGLALPSGASPLALPTAFLAKLGPDGSRAEFAQPVATATPMDPTSYFLATYITGLALEPSGQALALVGGTSCTDFGSQWSLTDQGTRYDNDFLAWQFQLTPARPVLGAQSPITAGGSSAISCSNPGAGFTYAWTTMPAPALQGTFTSTGSATGSARTDTFTPNPANVTSWPATATLACSIPQLPQLILAPVQVNVVPPPSAQISTSQVPFGGGTVGFTITGAYASIQGPGAPTGRVTGSATGTFSFPVPPFSTGPLVTGPVTYAVTVSNGAVDAAGTRTFVFPVAVQAAAGGTGGGLALSPAQAVLLPDAVRTFTADSGPVTWTVQESGPGLTLQDPTATTVAVTIPKAALQAGAGTVFHLVATSASGVSATAVVQVFGEDPTGLDPDVGDLMKMVEELGTVDPAEDLAGDGQPVDDADLAALITALNRESAPGGGQ